MEQNNEPQVEQNLGQPIVQPNTESIQPQVEQKVEQLQPEVLNEQVQQEETQIKKKFDIKSIPKNYLIIGAVVIALLLFFFVFTKNTTILKSNANNTKTKKEEAINQIIDVEDGTKIDPLIGHNFLKEETVSYTLNDTKVDLLVYYYGDEETITVNGKKEKYYILRKEVFLNNYHILKLYDVECSKKKEFDEMISNDNHNDLTRIINDYNNNGQYILYFYNQAILKDETIKNYVKSIIINKSSMILFNFIYKDEDLEADYFEEIDNTEKKEQKIAARDKINRTFKSERIETKKQTETVKNESTGEEETVEEITEITYTKYQVYQEGNMDIGETSIYYISGNCKEVQEVLVAIYNGVATSKYQKTYYGDNMIKKGVCK